MTILSVPAALALLLLALPSCVGGDAVEGRADRQTYDRASFGSWADADGDCRNTRHELLAELSTAPVQATGDDCRILRGRWYDPYTGEIEREARSLDVDHVVPLAWAWDHGAATWTRAERVRFANDPRNLVPVAAGANRSKGADGPDEWLPPYREGRCEYVLRFLRVARTYDLRIGAEESRRLDRARSSACA